MRIVAAFALALLAAAPALSEERADHLVVEKAARRLTLYAGGAMVGLTARFALIAHAAAPIVLTVVLERGGPLGLFATAAALAALAALSFALLRSRA